MIRRAVLEGFGKAGDALAIELFAGPVRNPMATAELIANKLIAVKGAALSVGFRRGLVLVHRGKGVAVEIGLETFRRDEDVPVMRITCTARTRTGIRECLDVAATALEVVLDSLNQEDKEDTPGVELLWNFELESPF